MATTTTIAAIIDQMVTKIIAISPANHADKKFELSPKRYLIRNWALAQNQGSAVFRRFQINRTGIAEESPFFDPTAHERKEELTCTICYPVQVALYGTDDLMDLEEFSRKDAQQVRDEIFSADNYLSGQNAAFVTIQPLDKSDDRVWFQDLTVDVRYYETQSL